MHTRIRINKSVLRVQKTAQN